MEGSYAALRPDIFQASGSVVDLDAPAQAQGNRQIVANSAMLSNDHAIGTELGHGSRRASAAGRGECSILNGSPKQRSIHLAHKPVEEASAAESKAATRRMPTTQ